MPDGTDGVRLAGVWCRFPPTFGSSSQADPRIRLFSTPPQRAAKIQGGPPPGGSKTAQKTDSQDQTGWFGHRDARAYRRTAKIGVPDFIVHQVDRTGGGVTRERSWGAEVVSPNRVIGCVHPIVSVVVAGQLARVAFDSHEVNGQWLVVGGAGQLNHHIQQGR